MAGHEEIKIHIYDETTYKDALVIISHPTVGRVSSIVANYIIDELDMEMTGAILSSELEPAAVISNGIPTPPIRIYANDYQDDDTTDFDQLVVIASDLPVKKELMFPIADLILDWFEEQEGGLLTTIEGINNEKLAIGTDPKVYHVASTDSAYENFSDIDTKELTNGMVPGLTGLLLYKSNMREIDTISILAEAQKQFPDSRSAAAILSVLDNLLPTTQVDPEPLLEKADAIEKQIQNSMSQIRQQNQTSDPEDSRGFFA